MISQLQNVALLLHRGALCIVNLPVEIADDQVSDMIDNSASIAYRCVSPLEFFHSGLAMVLELVH